jgi:hypothetical protein
MEDGVTEESVILYATTSIKTSFLYSVNYISPSLMVSQGKYFSLIGFLCFIMYFGLPGLVFLLSSLKE